MCIRDRKYIAPFLIKLDRMRDVCKLANIKAYSVYLELAYIPMNKNTLSEMVTILDDTDMTSSHELRVNLTFAEKIFSTQSLVMNESDTKRILKFVVDQLFHETSIEVRAKAGYVLSGAVSYTHLDVYKRQIGAHIWCALQQESV